MNRWSALSMLVAMGFLNYLDRNLLFPLLGMIARDLGLTETQLGLISGGFHVVYALTAPLLGYVSDKFSRKLILIGSLLAWSMVTALSGTAMGFVSLFIWRSLTGLGEGGYFPTAISLISDFFDKHMRGRAIAFHGVAVTLGGSAGYAIGGVLGEIVGWRGAFLLAIIPGLILAAIMWRFFIEPERGATSDSEEEKAAIELAHQDGAQRNYAMVVTQPVVFLISLAAFMAAFSMNGLTTFFPLYLEEQRGMSVAEAGVSTGLLFAVTLVGQLSGGTLSDWLSDRLVGARALLVALPYLLVGPAIAMIPGTPVLSIALAGFGLSQLARGFAEPNIYGSVMDAVIPEERGTANGFMLFMTFGGASLSPIVAGWTIRHLGYGAALGMLGIASACAGVLALFLFTRVRHKVAQSKTASLH